MKIYKELCKKTFLGWLMLSDSKNEKVRGQTNSGKNLVIPNLRYEQWGSHRFGIRPRRLQTNGQSNKPEYRW
jgi:hypothetical protein